MKATRLYLKEGEDWPDLEHAEICYWRDEKGVWYVYFPHVGAGSIANHDVTEHADGTITVSPSILLKGGKEIHGYLERGEWRDV